MNVVTVERYFNTIGYDELSTRVRIGQFVRDEFLLLTVEETVDLLKTLKHVVSDFDVAAAEGVDCV